MPALISCSYPPSCAQCWQACLRADTTSVADAAAASECAQPRPQETRVNIELCRSLAHSRLSDSDQLLTLLHQHGALLTIRKTLVHRYKDPNRHPNDWAQLWDIH